MKHPRRTCLALFAGGELGSWKRWRIGRHVARCARCRQHVEEFRADIERLKYAAAALPDEVNWNRLAAEMKANIHVGLAAGECVDPAETETRLAGWRRAVAFAPVVVSVVTLVVIGMWLQPPRPRAPETTWVEGTLLEATPEGIEWRQGDRMLSLRHPEAGDVTYVVNAQGTLRARYVDSETGQVTIHNVYAE